MTQIIKNSAVLCSEAKHNGVVGKHSGMVGVTIHIRRVASAKENRFVEFRRLQKEFFFTADHKKVTDLPMLTDKKHSDKRLDDRLNGTNSAYMYGLFNESNIDYTKCNDMQLIC